MKTFRRFQLVARSRPPGWRLLRSRITAPFLALAAGCGLVTWSNCPAEVLYNGLELPAPWPPPRTHAELTSGAPMPVPYLAKPPAVIPVDVGRQLFVDDFLIESTTLQRRFHQPAYHPASPVLRPERVWEKSTVFAFAAPFSDGVWW